MNSTSSERKSGMVKIQWRVSPPLSPLEQMGKIYKNSAGNSIIKYPVTKKNAGSAGQPIFWKLPHISGKMPTCCASLLHSKEEKT
jgi:hypothetical protein